MGCETIYYNGNKFDRYPNSSNRHVRVYFWCRRYGKKTLSLHRTIWEDNYGEIPKNHIIHHKDNNPLNNEPTNLECISKKEHAQKYLTEELKEKWRKNLEKNARPKAIEWHKSQEGRIWHLEHYKLSLAKAKMYEHICIICKKKYKTTKINKAKYCSDKCRHQRHRKCFQYLHSGM